MVSCISTTATTPDIICCVRFITEPLTEIIFPSISCLRDLSDSASPPSGAGGIMTSRYSSLIGRIFDATLVVIVRMMKRMSAAATPIPTGRALRFCLPVNVRSRWKSFSLSNGTL